MARADFITSLLLIALGAGALAEALRMPRLEHLEVNPYTVPGIVPGALSAVILLLGTVLLVRAIRQDGWRLLGPGPGRGGGLWGERNRRLALVLALTLGYAAGLVGRLPFWLATAVFVFAFIVLFEWPGAAGKVGRARLLAAAGLQAVVVALVVSAVFQYLFLVRLP